MCKCNMLNRNSNGYVALCPSCNSIQVRFDNILLTFTRDEFERFHSFVIFELNKDLSGVDLDEKLYLYHTESASVNMILSPSDLQRLDELISPAEIVLKAAEIIFQN